jgi:serine/threonine protein kinase/WD40 repeat protein
LRAEVNSLLHAAISAGDYLRAGPAVSPQLEAEFARLKPEEPGERIEHYKLLQEIGQGGFGTVWMAEQEQPVKRRVALKIIKMGMDTREVIARFEQERQALAMMDHPNIARVFDAGATPFGRPYFVMELVKGVPITEFCDEQQVDTQHRLELFGDVCSAINHAHQKGVIHRDIKPSNVMITLHGDKPVVKVIDFGIAKATKGKLTDKTLFTRFEQFVGTPVYMSPEQATTSGLDIDTRSDIYALGILLYELLTGKPPFDAKSLASAGYDEMRRIIREVEPPKPSLKLSTIAREERTRLARARHVEPDKLSHLVEPDLDWIVMKCLEKDRSRRYETANNLARDVERYLRNEPITARSPSRAYQFQKFIRRNKLAFASITAITLALLMGLGTSVRMFFEEKAAYTREAALRQRAEEAEHETQRQLHTALVQQARGAVRSAEVGRRFEALDALQRAVAISNTAELRREALAALALSDFRFERQFNIPQGARAALDPTFARVAMAAANNAVEIRSVSDGELLVTMAASRHPASIMEWSPDGRYFAVARRKISGGYDLEICDVAAGRQVLFVPHLPFGAISFHPTLPRVLFSDAENSVTLRDLADGRTVETYGVTGLIYFLRFSPSARSFVVQHGRGELWSTSIVAAESGTTRLMMTSGGVEEIAWHPGETWMALGATSGEVILLNSASGEKSILGRHQNRVETVAFSPDGKFLCTGGDGHEVVCWDFQSRQRAFHTPSQTLRIQFHRDGKQVAVVSRSEITFHSVHQPLAHRELDPELAGSARHGVFSPDGRWLAISGGYNGFALWDLNADAPGFRVRQPQIMTPFFSPDSLELYATWENGIARWRLPRRNEASLEALSVYQPPRILCGGFSSDSLVLGTSPGIVILPEHAIATGPGRLEKTGTSYASISPDGRWLSLPKREPPYLNIYRIDPWDGMRFVAMDAGILAQAFTRDELAVCTFTSVSFLDTNRWEIQRRFPVSLDRNARMIFMPDDDSFWLVRDGRTAALHDTHTFETLLPLPVGTVPLAVSPDGSHLAVSVDGEHLQLWDFRDLRKQLGALGLDWKSTAASPPLGGRAQLRR